MDYALEKLDMSMKSLCLELMKYSKDDHHYQQILSALAQQYQAFNTCISLAQDDMNNTYYCKYSDIGYIKSLLMSAGYLEQSKARRN